MLIFGFYEAEMFVELGIVEVWQLVPLIEPIGVGFLLVNIDVIIIAITVRVGSENAIRMRCTIGKVF